MKSRVYETVGRPSVSPSVSLSVRSVILPRHAAGLLLWRRRAGDINGHRRPPGKREQSHVYSRRIRLNAGLFCFFTARRYATRYMLSSCVHLSVRLSVTSRYCMCRNDWTNPAGFGMEAFSTELSENSGTSKIRVLSS